jgi:hypothetical protein
LRVVTLLSDFGLHVLTDEKVELGRLELVSELV